MRSPVEVTGACNGFFGSIRRGRFPRPTPAASVILKRMSDVTRLLEAAAAGDRKAAADLMPLVYDELRKLAAARLTTKPVPGRTFP